MIIWQDNAFILSCKPLNERDMMVELLTQHHGRIRAVAKFGATSKKRILYQMGNLITCEWRAKQVHQMGSITAELHTGYVAQLLSHRIMLALAQSASSLTLTFVHEGEEAGTLYNAMQNLCAAGELYNMATAYCRFEQKLLTTCGVGLDLTTCAATGETENLTYISPKSGRAVSAEAGAPYAAKLFALPRIFHDATYSASKAELLDALRINAYFLDSRLAAPQDSALPQARERLEAQLQDL